MDCDLRIVLPFIFEAAFVAVAGRAGLWIHPFRLIWQRTTRGSASAHCCKCTPLLQLLAACYSFRAWLTYLLEVATHSVFPGV